MKTLILLLLSTFAYCQTTTIHFYYGTEKMLGSEIMFQIKDHTYLGGGFSGALNPDRSLNDEKWCSVYATASFGYIGNIMIKYKAGLATFTNKKITDVNYKPLIGIGAMYQISKDIALEIGYDTFNCGTVGFTVLF